MFGLTADYKLLPYKKGFKDGMIKGVVVAESVLTINQAARVAAKQPAAPISIGKPETMFSNSPGEYIKNSYRAPTRDIAAEMEAKFGISFLMPGSTKNRPAQLSGIYNEKTGETWRQARDRVANNFVDDNPSFRDMLMRGLIGGRSRSVFGTVDEFNKRVKKAPKGVEVIEIKRRKYNSNKKQRSDIVKYLKSVYKSESVKLKHLKNFFLAIQDYIKKNPQDTWLFLEMLRDSTSAGMGSIIRILAPVKFYTVNQKTKKPILNQDMVEEHTDPQNQIGTALLYAAINGNVKEVFNVIGGSYMQGSILITEDNIINNVAKDPNKRSLKKDMPDIYFDKIIPRLKDGSLKLDDGMASVVRLATQGVNLNQLMLIDSDQTIAEYFGVGIDTKNMTNAQIERLIPLQNELVIQILTGDMTKAQATKAINKLSDIKTLLSKSESNRNTNTIKAIQNINKYSRTGETRGMSTFDFDDTLAKTKSGVRATVPNIDGDPKPKRKVVFLAGGAGSGKSNVVNKLDLQGRGFKIVNQDISLEWLKKNSGLPENMNDLTKEQRSTLGKLQHQARGIAKRKMMKYQGNADGVVVDGTGASLKQMQKLVAEFEAKGYDVSMLFVETSLETALARNRARKERSLLDIIVRKNHEAVMNNKSSYSEMFGNRFMQINTDKLKLADPMPVELSSKMDDFIFSYEKLRLDAEEFAAQGASILEAGGKFDFSEFNDVVDGTPGPLLDKAKARAEKYGTKDMFVLTARPAESANAIHAFLKDQGLNIPINNITGLANSTGEAKANWMLEKFAEGYNDLYFVDDALANVEAVRDVLNQLDAKSKVVQAKTKFSKSASIEFNDILERVKNVKSTKTISEAEAKIVGRTKGKWDWFIPPSAEDFKGLLYKFLGKGKQGDADLMWFKKHLLDPFAEATRNWNTYKQSMSNDYAALKKKSPNVTKNLNKKVPGTNFTNDKAIRVYLWSKASIKNPDYKIPGISEKDQIKLINHVNTNPELFAFANSLSAISKRKEGYVKPSKFWMVESIASDLNNLVGDVGRKEFLTEWINNKNLIFSNDNLNKIEFIYGNSFREALENILYRMEHGSNRPTGRDATTNKFLNWINGSVGAVMFFNMRSAVLQTISTVNFINWADNNMFKAAAAFANQPQFWKDFAFIFNSDMLKQRRAGLQIDVHYSELSKAFDNGDGKPQAVIKYLLEIGFTPTKIADSFAIAMGGASFYRNRLNTYLKKGMSEAEAKKQTWLDFQEIAEETQQSSRPDLISMQQSGVLGRILLAWQNTPMQMTRLMKKALSDLINRRGDWKSNGSRIMYYGLIQNLIFGALQSALAFIMFGEDDEEIKKREIRVANGALDTILRGTGVYGAAISTLKNTVLKFMEQEKKGWNADHTYTIIEAINLSPPIGSKIRKIYNSRQTYRFNKGVGEELGWRIENPWLSIAANSIEALTNAPVARLVNKANNVEEALTGNHELWQRAALLMGWNRWNIGVEDKELEEAKDKAKETRKEKKEEKKKEDIKTGKVIRCSGIKSSGGRCSLTTTTGKKGWKCVHHAAFKDGGDRDGDGIKEYQCTGRTRSGKRCKNKGEYTGKKKRCYAHQ